MRRPAAPAIVGLLLAATGLVACGESARPAIELPAPDLGVLEPDVARTIGEAREAALAQPSQETLHRFGRALFAHRHLTQAEPVFSAAAEWPGARKFECLYLAGLAATETSQARAVELVGRALTLRRDYAPGFVKHALFLEDLGRYAEAEANYRHALDLDDHPFPLIGLGRCALQRGDARAAVAFLQRAFAAAPEAREASVALAQAYTQLGWEEEAQLAADRASVLSGATAIPDPIAQAVVDSAVSYQGRLETAQRAALAGDYARSLRLLDEAIAALPERVGGHLAAGVLLAGLGRNEAALSAFEAVLAREGHHVEAMARRGALLGRMRRPDDAEDALRAALAEDPNSAFVRYELAAFLEPRVPEEALAITEELLAERPNSRSGQLLLARLLVALGRADEASEHVTWVLRRYPGDAEAAELAREIAARSR